MKSEESHPFGMGGGVFLSQISFENRIVELQKFVTGESNLTVKPFGVRYGHYPHIGLPVLLQFNIHVSEE